MADNVELSVNSQLKKIVEDLEAISAKAKEVGKELEKSGEAVGDNVKKETEKTETFLGRLRSLSGRVADQMRGDFKTLFSINALRDSIKLSEQFRGSIKDTFNLSDAVRKLGGIFGVSQGEFQKFQTSLVKGLGEVGLSSEVATKSLEGLSQSGTPVTGGSVLGYSRTSGELASITRQQGSEGDISKLLAQVIQARGGDVNDMKQLGVVAEDVRRVFNATGSNASQTLESMKTIFTGMSKDFREKITSRGLAGLAASANIAGPNSIKFLQEFLGKSPIARKAMEAQGFKGVVTDKGLDIEKFQKASKAVLGRVGGDPRLAAQTLGLSEEAAEGFVRLSESLDRVKDAQDKLQNSSGSLEQQYKSSLGFGEAFRASINRVKRVLGGPLSAISQGGSDLLSSASQSDLGSAGVVAGGGILAALLAGAGTRGIGGGLLGGVLGSAAKGAAAEQLTGQKTIPVYVVNAAEIGGGGLGGAAGATGLAGLGKSALGKAGLFGLAAGGGAAAGYGLSKGFDKLTEGTSVDAVLMEAVTGLAKAVGLLPKAIESTKRSSPAGGFSKDQRVIVEANPRDFKISKQPTRGASY